MLIAGRSRAKAEAFCATLPNGAGREPLTFDRNGDAAAQLQQVSPDIVVDVTGPFQDYGAERYRLVQAAITLGIDYLDLADGSGFVEGIAQFDDLARKHGVFVLSGASSFPVLTVAVARRLAAHMHHVDTVIAGIAPSPYAGVGENVIRAIAGYAGKQVALRRDGRPANGYALIETLRYTIGPPGSLPLHNIRFSLVDVPDLRVLPQIWPELHTVWVGAGPVPEALHRMLNLLAWCVRLRVAPSLSPLARLFHSAINVLRWGEHRGGMFVLLRGTGTNGAACEYAWHLLAEGDDGPLIPSMTAAAIIRHCLDGRRPAAGASSAALSLELDDYMPWFAPRGIYTGVWETEPNRGNAPLYRRILGGAWNTLPVPLRKMHDIRHETIVEGRARIERGTTAASRLIAALFRFPQAGEDVPVRVTFSVRDGAETWRRSFAGRWFSSVQSIGSGRSERLLVERFGPFEFGLALVISGERLSLVVRNWRFLGVPLPLWWAPRGEAYEFAENGVFHFHVEIIHRWTGLIVRYQGWLAAPPQDDTPPPAD